MKKKRGMSEVVTTLIIILVSIVAIAIIWVAVRNMLNKSTEEVSLEKLTLGLEIKSVEILSADSVQVKVERTSGKGDMTGMRFVISNGTNADIFEVESSLGVLGKDTFTLTGVNVTNIKTVSVYPVLETSSGNEIVSENKFEYEMPTDEITISGLVSWWRFDGNASDSFGGNDGTITGDVKFVDGKFGQAADFDGDGDWITTSSFGIPNNDNTTTYSFWMYHRNNPIGVYNTIIGDWGSGLCTTGGNFIWMWFYNFTSTNRLYVYGCNGTASRYVLATNLSSDCHENWCHYVVNINYPKAEVKYYVNGVLVATKNDLIVSPGGWIYYDSVKTKYVGSYYPYANPVYKLNGSIDEFTIFSRTLTDEEIQALYTFQLNNLNFV